MEKVLRVILVIAMVCEKSLMKKKSASDPNHGPLLKIWCAAHRSNLAYKGVVKIVSEVKITVSDIVSIGNYFHVSGL